MAAEIHFVRRDQDLVVDEQLETVAEALPQGAPARLTKTGGGVIFVNWANVLYIEEVAAATALGA